ncbi:hypothetical protein [Subtercola endophyticus]|uniref:hypothetical protein n=1 Tax=Subtercola endophyticus TaxID=2895559 RepID=UPI001E5A035B|nr:hypothetical protein [Subtercola endophyticus]UFS58237.1 hypothetical protein LQ955_14620 [Subtercola endophyticus]
MPEADAARLKRVAYARDSSDDERMLALATLEQLAADAVVAHRAAEARSSADAERRARRAAERLRRLRILRTTAITAAVAVLIGFGVTAYATSGGPGGSLAGSASASPSGAPSGGSGSGSGSSGGTGGTGTGLAGNGRSTGASSSYGIGGDSANSAGVGAAGDSTGLGYGPSGSGALNSDGASTKYSNATQSVTSDPDPTSATGSGSERFGSDGSSRSPLGGSAAMSPALIFTVAQTAADHPAVAIPGDTVESTYRLLSRGQYTPGSAYAALSPDGRICLVVFGGDADFGETCQSVLLTLSNGLQAGVTSSTNLNPRSGSQLVTVVHFAATWNTDGTFALAVTNPPSSQPAG